MTREEAINEIKSWAIPSRNGREVLETLIPELAESEDESLKNKSGYYKAGKFWKASTLWNATKNKVPQRVSNRYILQECTWNIGNLQDFANEVKNVQEVSLDYPIILDMNGNIIDGAHRVVKAYLEGKDIDIVYIGDDEWPEPDYDEEKAVKESDDERVRKSLIKFLTDIKEISESGRTSWAVRKEDAEMCKSFIAYIEKQKESLPISETCKENANSFADGIIEVRSFQRGMEEGRRLEKQKEQKEETLRDFIDNFPYSAEQKEQKQEPFSCGRENGQPADPVFSKQEYESHPIVSKDTTSVKPVEFDGKTLLYTADKSYQIGFRDGVASVKPEEWSEEDEDMLNSCISSIEEAKENRYAYKETDGDTSYDHEIAWLKSLRNRVGKEFLQPHWKPSEEQMEALNALNCHGDLSYVGQQNQLISLYNDLKKLM